MSHPNEILIVGGRVESVRCRCEICYQRSDALWAGLAIVVLACGITSLVGLIIELLS